MSNFVFFTQANRAFGLTGMPLSGARAYFFASQTTNAVSVYADSALTIERSQPVRADQNGIFPPIYVAGAAALRVLVTDTGNNALPGYPQDHIVPLPAETTGAELVSFNPVEKINATNVQAAIEQTAELAQDQSSVLQRAFSAWTTGGTGNDFTITPSPAITGYGTWQLFLVRPDRANSGPAILNVNGLGARPLRLVNRSGVSVQLTGGEVQPGFEFLAIYDGTAFNIVQNRAAGGLVTNAKGTSTRSANGLQTCTLTNVTFTFTDTDRLGYTWTFPQPFAATPHVVGTVPTGAADFIGVTGMVVGGFAQAEGSTSCALRFWRSNGAPVFAAGNEIRNVRLTAIGRYL